MVALLLLAAALAALGLVIGIVYLVVRAGRRARRLGRRPSADTWSAFARVPLGPGEDFDFDIVGEASYLGTLRAAAGDRLAREETVVLPALVVPEPDNAYDPNAIAVYLEGFGKVGYFSREDAVEYADVARGLVQRNAIGICDAFLTGGFQMKGSKKRANIGVRLSIKNPEDF